MDMSSILAMDTVYADGGQMGKGAAKGGLGSRCWVLMLGAERACAGVGRLDVTPPASSRPNQLPSCRVLSTFQLLSGSHLPARGPCCHHSVD